MKILIKVDSKDQFLKIFVGNTWIGFVGYIYSLKWTRILLILDKIEFKGLF